MFVQGLTENQFYWVDSLTITITLVLISITVNYTVLSTVFMKPPSTWTRQPFSSSSFKGIFLKCDKTHIAHIFIYLFIGWFARHY